MTWLWIEELGCYQKRRGTCIPRRRASLGVAQARHIFRRVSRRLAGKTTQTCASSCPVEPRAPGVRGPSPRTPARSGREPAVAVPVRAAVSQADCRTVGAERWRNGWQPFKHGVTACSLLVRRPLSAQYAAGAHAGLRPGLARGSACASPWHRSCKPTVLRSGASTGSQPRTPEADASCPTRPRLSC
jgi:hypothetical protein